MVWTHEVPTGTELAKVEKVIYSVLHIETLPPKFKLWEAAISKPVGLEVMSKQICKTLPIVPKAPTVEK